MMQLPLPNCALLAAGFDWLEALLPFLFVAFWIVSQVFAVLRRLQGGGRQQPPPRPRFDPGRDRPRPPQPVADDGIDARSELEKQIAEFLREATGEKKPQRPINQPAPRKIEPVTTVRPQPPRPERRDSERRGPQTPRVAAPGQRDREKEQTKVVVPRETAMKPIAAAPSTQEGNTESVARHVQDAFSRELKHLRGTITQDDAQAGGAPRKVAPSQAEELMHLLRNPATVRQVILLREVLDRPVDRW